MDIYTALVALVPVITFIPSYPRPVLMVQVQCPSEVVAGMQTPPSLILHKSLDFMEHCSENNRFVPVEIKQVCT